MRRGGLLLRSTVLTLIVVLGASMLVATGSAAVNALVVGKVMNCAAPSHTACKLQRHAVVSAFNTRHQLVASETITNGNFSFTLAPGHYSLSAKKQRGGSTRRPVTAEAGQTVSTKIIFNMGDFTNQPGR